MAIDHIEYGLCRVSHCIPIVLPFVLEMILSTKHTLL